MVDCSGGGGTGAAGVSVPPNKGVDHSGEVASGVDGKSFIPSGWTAFPL